MDIDKLIQVLEVAKAVGVGSVYIVEAGFDGEYDIYRDFDITGVSDQQYSEALVLLKAKV